MVRTLKFALRRDPATSRTIASLATQQNAAYNKAVSILNREPHLPKRSGKDHPDALNKRITTWRKTNRLKTLAPYNVHQVGAEQAWEANQLLQQRRAEREERIAKALADGEEPKYRDRKPHRRTLAYRSRKRSRLTLNITARRTFNISPDGRTITCRSGNFTLQLRKNRNLLGLDVRTIQLVPVKHYNPRTPLELRHYKLHVQVAVPAPTPLEKLDIQSPDDILGADRGAKNHAVTSTGHRVHHQPKKPRRNRIAKHQRHIQGKPRHSRRRQHAVAEDRQRARRYIQTRDQDLRRQFRHVLLATKPKLIALESLKPINMQTSARGTIAKLGKNVKAKRKLNESLAEAAIGHVGRLLTEEGAKLGTSTVSVPAPGTSQTCPRCEERHRDVRESQGVFRCRTCTIYIHPDQSAGVIVRNRLFVRYCEWQHGYTPDVAIAPTGWRQQPSGSGPYQPRLGLELIVFKPKGTATSSSIRNRVCGLRPDRRIPSGGPRRPK